MQEPTLPELDAYVARHYGRLRKEFEDELDKDWSERGIVRAQLKIIARAMAGFLVERAIRQALPGLLPPAVA